MEPKNILLALGGVIGVVAIIYAIITVNVGSAISKCEKAGYGTPERSLSVTTCPADEDYAHDSLAIVAANVANNPKPALTDESTRYIRNSLAETEGELDAYVYSVVPGGIKLTTEDKKERRAGNVNTFIRNSTKKIDSLNETISQKPTASGSDYFNNIITAARAVKTSPKVESPLVIVIGSGLSDAQPLNFANGDLLHASPSDVLAELKENNVILPGELSGVKIVWSGMGITASPQQALDAQEKNNLKRIYTTVLESMGATLIADDTVMASDSIETDLKVQTAKVNGLKGGIVVYKIGENSIGFTPGTADIRDKSKAANALQAVVESFNTCRSATLAVEGYQAKMQDENIYESSALSQSRAEAVKQLLTAHDIPESSILATGKGNSNFDGRVDEINTEGKWDESRAQSNRIVLIKMDGGSCN